MSYGYYFAHLDKFEETANRLGYLDRALWNLFREYFNGWLPDHFQLAGNPDLVILRMLLRQRGVYVSTDPVITIAQTLCNLLWAKEPQAWPPKDLEYQRGIYLKSNVLPPSKNFDTRVTTTPEASPAGYGYKFPLQQTGPVHGEMHFQYSSPPQPEPVAPPPPPQPRYFPELVAPSPSRQPVYSSELVAPPSPQPRQSAIPPPQTPQAPQTRQEALPSPTLAIPPTPSTASPVLPPPKQSAPPKQQRPLRQPSSYRPPKPQTCIKCSTLFPSGTALHKHLPLCEPFECTKCHTTFRSKNTLHKHLCQRFICRQKRLEKEKLPDDLMAIQVQETREVET